MVWIVLPTYDEAENVGPISAAILDALPDATLLVVDDGEPGRGQRCCQRPDVIDDERRVRLAGRTKVAVDAQMHLQFPTLEPTATAGREVRRFRHLRDAEQTFVERRCRDLTATWHCQLDVVEPKHGHLTIVSPAPPPDTASARKSKP